MRIPEYSVSHGRTGWWLYLSHTSLTKLVLTSFLDRKLLGYLASKFVFVYRPWSWALCKLDGKTVGWVSISPIEARTLDPEFVLAVEDTFDEGEMEPDGSLRRDLWK